MSEVNAATAAQSPALSWRQKVLFGQVAVFVIWMAVWQILAGLELIDPFISASPWSVVVRLADWFVNGTALGSFWYQVLVTLGEAAGGFVLGVIAGVFLGILLGQIDYLADVLNPYIKFFNAVPRIVLGSIFVMWLGLGLPAKAFLAAVLVFFVVFFNAFQGARSVDPNLVANIRILGGSRMDVVRNVVLPSALTWIIASLHVALGLAIVGAIVGEILGAQHGLGLLIKFSQNNFDSPGVYGCMFVIGAIVLSVEAVMARVEKRLLKWQKPKSSTSAQDA